MIHSGFGSFWDKCNMYVVSEVTGEVQEDFKESLVLKSFTSHI